MVGIGLVAWFFRRTRAGRFAFYCYLLLTPAWFIYSLLDGAEHIAIAVAVLGAVVAGAAFLMRVQTARVVTNVGLFC